MTSYQNIKTYQQLLAENNLGSQGMQFFNPQGRLESGVPAMNTLTYYDQDYGSTYYTYGAVADNDERNRRIAGAYGPTYTGYASWINPVNRWNTYVDDQFYYLQDFIPGGQYAHLFIEGLTFYTSQRPDVYYQFYGSTFRDDPLSMYRVDILGSEYPYTHGGVKADIIIQQFGRDYTSQKLYLTYTDTLGHGAWHEGYKMKIPATLMLFNDRLYDATIPPPDPIPPYVPPPDNTPVIGQVPPESGIPVIGQIPPEITPPPAPFNPYSPYGNFGGDTTDTGPGDEPDYGPIDAYNADLNRQDVRYYRPELHWWQKWFTWY